MKLGDLTEDSDYAKKHLSDTVDGIKARNVAKNATLFVAHGKDQQTRLLGYEHELEKSQLKSEKLSESAKTRVDSFLGKSSKDVEIENDGVLKDFAKEQELEIAKVLKHQPTLAPVAKTTAPNEELAHNEKQKAANGELTSNAKQTSPVGIANTSATNEHKHRMEAKTH